MTTGSIYKFISFNIKIIETSSNSKTIFLIELNINFSNKCDKPLKD